VGQVFAKGTLCGTVLRADVGPSTSKLARAVKVKVDVEVRGKLAEPPVVVPERPDTVKVFRELQ
jgi:hypothetical protein